MLTGIEMLQQEVQRKAWNKQRQLRQSHNHDAADELIARTIQPKMKGWAWKSGHPISFADPAHTQALINWASTQPFWHTNASADWGTNVTWTAIYTDACLELSENRCTREQFGQGCRQMVVEAIEAFNLSDKDDDGHVEEQTEGTEAGATSAAA